MRWSYQSRLPIPRLTTITTRSDGPLKGPSNDVSQKARFCTIQNQAPPRSCRPSPCSRRARASFLCRRRQERVLPPALLSHHVETGRVEECTPFLRSRRRATELCPHRLVPRSVTLSWGRGTKTKNKQTTHTTRPQTHWDGLCRLTRTAVALWSCKPLIRRCIVFTDGHLAVGLKSCWTQQVFIHGAPSATRTRCPKIKGRVGFRRVFESIAVH